MVPPSHSVQNWTLSLMVVSMKWVLKWCSSGNSGGERKLMPTIEAELGRRSLLYSLLMPLKLPAVFADDYENPSPSESNNSKFQTWNSQYYRGEPIVVVAKENSQQATDSATVETPMFLPVRSLKNGVAESSMIDSKVNSFGRSNSRRFSKHLSKLSGAVSLEESEENIVLRSPIPWRSRSGRMEIKEDFTQTPEINPIDSPSSRFQSSNKWNTK
ncbi:hypothetical protein LXL04_002365 [Taraxacum kok-saghyz]